MMHTCIDRLATTSLLYRGLGWWHRLLDVSILFLGPVTIEIFNASSMYRDIFVHDEVEKKTGRRERGEDGLRVGIAVIGETRK